MIHIHKYIDSSKNRKAIFEIYKFYFFKADILYNTQQYVVQCNTIQHWHFWNYFGSNILENH